MCNGSRDVCYVCVCVCEREREREREREERHKIDEQWNKNTQEDSLLQKEINRHITK